jgi:hypothetical protein
MAVVEQERPSAKAISTPRPEPRQAIVTRAEVAECTCPEQCERDHEWD